MHLLSNHYIKSFEDDPPARKKPKRPSFDFEKIFFGDHLILPDSRLKFLDTKTKVLVNSLCGEVSLLLFNLANEPSKACYRVRQHAKNKIPIISQQIDKLEIVTGNVGKKILQVKQASAQSKEISTAISPIMKSKNILCLFLYKKPAKGMFGTDSASLPKTPKKSQNLGLEETTKGTKGTTNKKKSKKPKKILVVEDEQEPDNESLKDNEFVREVGRDFPNETNDTEHIQAANGPLTQGEDKTNEIEDISLEYVKK